MNKEQLDCLHVECKQWVGDGLDFLKSGITYGQALELIEALKEAQKDAKRYRTLKKASSLGIGINGAKWELRLSGPAPDCIERVDKWLDGYGHNDKA